MGYAWHISSRIFKKLIQYYVMSFYTLNHSKICSYILIHLLILFLDFFSIVKYLDLLEVNFDYTNFIKAIKEKTEDSIIWFSNFVWSNSIKNINDELNLPKPIFEIHWLSFSTIEKYFYQKTRKLYTIKISDIKKK